MALQPGWDTWCQKEFVYKMYHDGKLQQPRYAGAEAKKRRDKTMYQTRERIFPDEFETRCDLGNFEQHGRTQAVQEKDDPQRRARKQLAKKCRELEKALDAEVETTRRLEDRLHMRAATSRPYAVAAAADEQDGLYPAGGQSEAAAAYTAPAPAESR